MIMPIPLKKGNPPERGSCRSVCRRHAHPWSICRRQIAGVKTDSKFTWASHPWWTSTKSNRFPHLYCRWRQGGVSGHLLNPSSKSPKASNSPQSISMSPGHQAHPNIVLRLKYFHYKTTRQTWAICQNWLFCCFRDLDRIPPYKNGHIFSLLLATKGDI